VYAEAAYGLKPIRTDNSKKTVKTFKDNPFLSLLVLFFIAASFSDVKIF
jgi:hypothetical protein